MVGGDDGVRAQGRAVELRALLLGRGRRRRRPLALHRRRAARRSRSTSSPRSRSTRRATRSSSRASCTRSATSATAPWPAASKAIKPELTWGFRMVFDRLEQMSDELRHDPSLPRLSAAIALYHIVIEATLAQPGQHFITSYLHDRDLLPGFREGMDKIAQDEQRHIAFGVKLLSDIAAPNPECRYAVAELLREVLPYTASVLVPPGWDLRYTEVFGFKLEDIAKEGADSLETKMRSAGMPMDELPGPADLRLRPARRAPRRERPAAREGRRPRGEDSARPAPTPRRSPRCSTCWARASTTPRRRPSPARSSGTSRTPSPGTWSSRTATRAWSRAAPRTRPSRSSAASRTGRTCSPGARTRCGSPHAGGCGRAATSAGCGARAACSPASGTEPAQNRSLDVRLEFCPPLSRK